MGGHSQLHGKRGWSPKGKEWLALLQNQFTQSIKTCAVDAHHSGFCNIAINNATPMSSKDNKKLWHTGNIFDSCPAVTEKKNASVMLLNEKRKIHNFMYPMIKTL